MWKRYCAITAATLCLLLSASASEASSATAYTMTAAEMAESQAALKESRAELSKLKTESIKLQIELQAQSSLLESANKSLQASAREEKRVKRQRLLWQIIAGGVVVVLVKEKL